MSGDCVSSDGGEGVWCLSWLQVALCLKVEEHVEQIEVAVDSLSHSSGQLLVYIPIINPRHACAERVTVVVSCVCMYVCPHAILAVRAIRSITKDAIVLSIRFVAILKWCFSLNCLIRKLERLLLTLAGAAIFS